MLSMRPDKLQTIEPDDFRALAKDFNVKLPERFLYEKEAGAVGKKKAAKSKNK